jgi:hypothetical protein
MNHITRYRLEERRLLADGAYTATTVADFENRDLAADELDRLAAKHPNFYGPRATHRLLVREVRS